MSRKLYWSSIIVVLVLSACQPGVVFTEPQPKDVNALEVFPRRLQGRYLSTEDSTFLYITGNSIIRMYNFVEKMHVDDLDSTQQIVGDSLYDLTTNIGQPIEIEGDSIKMCLNETDTLFSIGRLNVLKKFKGYYFVNINTADGNWEVKELAYSHGRLSLSGISAKEDLEKLRAISEENADTLSYVFSPSRQQFKKFVRNEGFLDKEEFLKLGD